MTKNFCAGSLLCVALSVPAVLHAADAKPDKAAEATAAATSTSTAPVAANADSTTDAKTENGKLKGRLPSGWGKLGITDPQKLAIYKVEATYADQLDSLRKQIADVEAKRDADMRNILTDAQQKRLGDKPDKAEAKAAKKAAAAEAKNGDAKNSDGKNADAKNTPAASTNSNTKTSIADPKHGAATDSTTKVAGSTN
jgi:hypothetical protein